MPDEPLIPRLSINAQPGFIDLSRQREIQSLLRELDDTHRERNRAMADLAHIIPETQRLIAELDTLRRERDALAAALRRCVEYDDHAPDCASKTCRQCQADSDAYRAGEDRGRNIHKPDPFDCDCGVPALLAAIDAREGRPAG